MSSSSTKSSRVSAGNIRARRGIRSPEPVAGMSFLFRGLHPQVAIGTATDRYAGWVGQIYTRTRYAGHITRRTHEVGGRPFIEEVLPVASVEEYFEHFGVLELDFTFYRPLLDERLHPTDTFHLVRTYAGHLKEGDRLILKAPHCTAAPTRSPSAKD